jgi:hypothetical protein
MGAQGPQGYCCVGATGATGAQGLTGPSGGLQGPTGPTGPPGTGYTINNYIIDGTMSITDNLDSPAYTSLSPITIPTSSHGNWALSWSISEPEFSDSSNKFYITLSDSSTEYNPIIYNLETPYTLNTNSTSTTGSANDIITIMTDDLETSLTLKIYQSATTNIGYKLFNFTVTLTKL